MLSVGLEKWNGDEQTVARLHGFASGTYPFLLRIEPKTFMKLLSASEITLGSALLVPLCPPGWSGLELTAFSAGLLGLYARTPGMHRGPHDPRSSPEGIILSKDVWLLGAGLALFVDALTSKD